MNLMRAIKKRVREASLAPITRSVAKDRLTYLSVAKLGRIERAIAEAKSLPGDFLEFGVALGGSAIILARHVGKERRFIGFDVFGMIPPPTSEKDDDKSKSRYETIAAGQSTGIGGDTYYGYKNDLFSEVKGSFLRYGVPVDDVNIILRKGLFEDTLPDTRIDVVALAHIDCDWYDPVRYCLRSLADKLTPGGLFIIDDYNDYGGCRTAVDEFLTERPDFALEAGANPFLRKR